MSGLFVAAILGKFWPRATWQGGIAALAGGSITFFIILYTPNLLAFWGNPVLPALAGALVAGVVVSLITPKNMVSKEEALRILDEERARVDSGTTFNNDTNKHVV